MSAKFIIATNRETNLPVHVVDAKNGLGCNCVCDKCEGPLQAVQGKNTPKESWYFRHDDDTSNCPGSNESALHKYAKLVLYESQFVNSIKKKIIYSDPLLECVVNNHRSDVKVKYGESDLHFEVIVNNDLTPEKRTNYRSNKINCIKIDLSHPALRSAPPDQIKYAVLFDNGNKDFIQWNEEKPQVTPITEKKSNWEYALGIGIFLTAVVIFIFKHIRSLPKRRNRRLI